MADADTGGMIRQQLGTLFLGILSLTVLVAIAATFVSRTFKSVSRWRALRGSGVTTAKAHEDDDERSSKHGLSIPFVDPDKIASIDSVMFDRYGEYNKLKDDYLKGNFGGSVDRDLVDQRMLYRKYDDYDA